MNPSRPDRSPSGPSATSAQSFSSSSSSGGVIGVGKRREETENLEGEKSHRRRTEGGSVSYEENGGRKGKKLFPLINWPLSSSSSSATVPLQEGRRKRNLMGYMGREKDIIAP